ncbi:unnamed protein product [Laminaria digitata]
MRSYTPLFFACALSHIPVARPLVVVGRAGLTAAHHGARHVNTGAAASTTMMAKPSQPVPRNIKDTVSSLRAAVQEGLKGQRSRMDVDLPFAARLGVETGDGDKDKKTATAADVERADRELARLFLEMFDVIGEQVVVAFPTDEDAKKATKAWAKGTPFKGTVTSMNPKAQKSAQMKRGSEAVLGFAAAAANKKKKKKQAAAGGGGKKGGGEAAGAGDHLAGRTGTARIAPPGTEVLLVVAPKQPELMVVQKLSNDLGQGCLVVLLNARLHQANFMDDEQRHFFEEEFESMFHLRPVAAETEDFLYRAYPKDWTVARKPKLGPPKVLHYQEKRPTQEEIMAAVEEGDKTAGVFGNLF